LRVLAVLSQEKGPGPTARGGPERNAGFNAKKGYWIRPRKKRKEFTRPERFRL